MEHFAPGIREITPKDKGANYHKRTETDRHFLTRCGTACRVPLSRKRLQVGANHAATSLGLRKSILILVELQLAHWNLWTARSRRVGCGSMAASVIGLRHFVQVSFMKRSKDIVGISQLAHGLAHEGVGAGSVCTPHSKMHLMVARRTIVNADMRVIFFGQ